MNIERAMIVAANARPYKRKPPRAYKRRPKPVDPVKQAVLQERNRCVGIALSFAMESQGPERDIAVRIIEVIQRYGK